MTAGAIPRHYAEMLITACASQGQNTTRLLNAAGLSESQWKQGGDLSPLEFGRLFQRALWLMGDESFGLIGGKGVPNGSFRLLCLCAIQCLTLKDAMVRIAEYCDVAIGYEIKPVVVEQGAVSRVHIVAAQEGSWTENASFSEAKVPIMMLIWLNLATWLIGQPLPVNRVLLKSPPRNASKHRGFFDCDVLYGQSKSALELATTALQLPVVRSEQDVEVFLADALPTLLSPRLTDATWANQVLHVFARTDSSKLPPTSVIARNLNVSGATLRRRLSSEDTSVQQLKDQYRCSAAMRYLASSGMSLKEIALRCGFDNPADFNRAFKRWSMQTPGQYRGSLRGSDRAE